MYSYDKYKVPVTVDGTSVDLNIWDFTGTAYESQCILIKLYYIYGTVELCTFIGIEDYDRFRPPYYPQTVSMVKSSTYGDLSLFIQDVFLVCFSLDSPTSFHNVKASVSKTQLL